MSGGEAKDTQDKKAKSGSRDAIVDALMRLAARRNFADIAISDIAREAGLSLADFRDAFPSKGAVLGAFSRRIDREVLDHLGAEHDDEPSRERLYHVLAARLTALEPYRDAVIGIVEWAEKDPLSSAALHREVVNSMRFMLEAADIDSEGPVGALKLQGLAFAWMRVLDAWRDDQPGETHRALAALDRELNRGEKFIDRAEDIARIAEPFRVIAHRMFHGLRGGFKTSRKSGGAEDLDHPHAGA
ncbi:MAG TPA: TetR/AcrR family transcriptional regulator [Methylocystis sp.]|nr:TetR/AcrR family transcriptional regulator [Methylocystis sp.]